MVLTLLSLVAETLWFSLVVLLCRSALALAPADLPDYFVQSQSQEIIDSDESYFGRVLRQ